MTLFYAMLDRCLLLAFRLAAGRLAAARLLTAANDLYPLVGSPSPRIRRSRLYFRSLITAHSTRRWLAFLFENPPLRQAAVRNMDLIEKIHRPYLSKNFSCPERQALLQSHYAFCLAHPHGPGLLAAGLAEVELTDISGKSGIPYQLVLAPPVSLQKEGELALRLELGSQVLLQLAFSFSFSNGTGRILIGCLQGSPDENTREKIREATKEMHGLRARNLLLIALQAIARAYGMQGIFGVGDQQHIYRHWRKQRQIMQSYDDIWNDLGGVLVDDGLFELPLLPVQRPLSEYPSNKRSAISKRHALENHVTQALLCSPILAGLASDAATTTHPPHTSGPPQKIQAFSPSGAECPFPSLLSRS